MSVIELEMAQLLASKICHDLISPVAAVNNGLELLQEDDCDIDMQKQALGLIQDSAISASLKLQILRGCFGAGQTIPEKATSAELHALLKEFLEKNKITLSCDIAENRSLSRDECRLIMNVILLSCDILIRGGDIALKISEDNTLSITLSGQKIIFPDEKKDFLTKELSKPDQPRLVGLYFIRLLMEMLGYQSLDIQSEDVLLLTFKQ